MSARPLLFALACIAASGCADDGGGGPVFPEDYLATYTEVRDCRQSGDHDLNRIRVLAGPNAVDAYVNRDQPFPVGAVVLKEEYDFADSTCSGAIKQWTVMQKREANSAPEQLDWFWQRVDSERNVVGEDTPRCYGCHTGCTPAMGGYDHTCTVP